MSNLRKKESIEFEEINHLPDVAPGQWWIRNSDNEYVCVMSIGSNYIETKSVHLIDCHTDNRVFQKDWSDNYTRAVDPEKHIVDMQSFFNNQVHELMAEVNEITRRLGVSRSDAIAESSTSQALATLDNSDYSQYKDSLVKAKNETVPQLFIKIKKANSNLRNWLLAPTLPMSVSVADQNDVIKNIESRVFNVELYSGLTECAHQILDGEPAAMGEKLHLFQRRHYMDEECLIGYSAGGMEFESIFEFDEWISKEDNLNRILPYPKCIVAFRIRRYAHRINGFISLSFTREIENMKTFLYVRNGEKLYRINTNIEFDQELFPDMDKSIFSSDQVIYARDCNREFKFMKENEYKACRREYKAWGKLEKKYDKLRERYRSLSEDERKTAKYPGYPERPSDEVIYIKSYHPVNNENIKYDDIIKYLKSETERYNRISLIIQGLFDRSDILHPHPKVTTWTADGFDAAIKLIYDKDRALTEGDPPDFTKFRLDLNKTLKKGSTVFGQRIAWRIYVDEKKEESERRNRCFSYGSGPPKVCKIDHWQSRVRKATLRWQESAYTRNGTKNRKFVVDADEFLINLDEYKPGDYKKFFNDPRTRAEYVEWAPYLLFAEEYHAGNVDDDGYIMTAANMSTCKKCGIKIRKYGYRDHECDGSKKKTYGVESDFYDDDDD